MDISIKKSRGSRVIKVYRFEVKPEVARAFQLTRIYKDIISPVDTHKDIQVQAKVI